MSSIIINNRRTLTSAMVRVHGVSRPSTERLKLQFQRCMSMHSEFGTRSLPDVPWVNVLALLRSSEWTSLFLVTYVLFIFLKNMLEWIQGGSTVSLLWVPLEQQPAEQSSYLRPAITRDKCAAILMLWTAWQVIRKSIFQLFRVGSA